MDGVSLDVLALAAYEAQRPAAELACRSGDDRFFPGAERVEGGV